ncbi:acetyltransferase [Bordetella avium]|nr:acetyltransferase [Bordetella avium]
MYENDPAGQQGKKKMLITRLFDTGPALDGLSELLKNCVDEGASIGFLPPLAQTAAQTYWREVGASLGAGSRVLLVCTQDQRMAGSVQLSLCGKENGLHRAEVEKLMVHTDFRGQGIGRQLLEAIEAIAVQARRSLLVLDTRTGDVASRLYRSAAYVEAGQIPGFARDGHGELCGTTFFYKVLAGTA